MEEPSQKQELLTSPASLLERIAACRTLPELKALLLSREVVLDEQLLAAFDQRILELEQKTGQSFLSNF